MGLLDKLKKKKENIDWNDAYHATPKFYTKPDGHLFGAIALTEDTKTILPKNPQVEYRVNGKSVADWKLVLVSTSKDTIIGDNDYFTALKKIEQYIVDENKNTVLVKGLALTELESLKG